MQYHIIPFVISKQFTAGERKKSPLRKIREGSSIYLFVRLDQTVFSIVSSTSPHCQIGFGVREYEEAVSKHIHL